MRDFAARYGPWAVIAGASEGMGEQFGRQLAAQGLNVVLIARRAPLVEGLAEAIRTEFAVQARALAVDLASPEAAARVIDETAGLDCGLLIYNAAFSGIGPFVEQPLDNALTALSVNVRTPTVLAHHFGRRFAERGRGGLMLLSSLTAFQGSPFVATYGATKSFNLALAEALWFELRPRGVDVLGVCAGATSTPNYLKAAPPQGAPGQLAPDQVVREALAALGQGPFMIPGAFNRFASFLMRRLLPRASTISIMGNQTRRLSLKP